MYQSVFLAFVCRSQGRAQLNSRVFTCSDLFFQCSVWVARKPPGFAFIDFDDRRDAQDAIRELDGNNQGCLFFICILKRLPFAIHLFMINLFHFFLAMGSFVMKNMALLNYFKF